MAEVFVESITYGLYVATFGYTVNALLSTGARWKRHNELNYPMIVVTLIMFLNATIALGTVFCIAWRGFITPSEAGGGLASFSDISEWCSVTEACMLLLQTTVGDAMLIYRCWVVYNRSLPVVAFSILIWCGGTVCAVVLVIYQATLRSQALVTAGKMYPFGISFWVLTVTLNIITTVLMVLPIWKVIRQNEQFAYHRSPQSNGLRNVMHIIIESGLLYTVLAFMTFVAYTTNSNSLYIISSAVFAVAGIAFNLIIIRTAKDSRKKETLSTAGTSLPLHIMRPRDITLSRDDKTQGIQVVVSQDVMDDSLRGSIFK
ncbi:hypothetical protein BDQ12DRAFT_618421 [Crucibulum laeve]|uniref:G-protein coupled receptors family 1 profile domain-containing protein n=1 Tax=Crucibulum laeve TaxID=68775 RepID=A0A5C3LEZ8_9AGAR|nr:hypothetical protein BDQ12DRAFT_618421 [Crucibulum laeve]